ncbi:MAG: sulfite exporter TauE/SafE family protein [Pseudomonadota bacterium]
MESAVFALDTKLLVFASFSIFLAYAVKGISGFGAGLVAIPLLAFVLPLHICVPAVSLLSYAGNIAQFIALRRDASWHDVWPLAPFSILGVATAVWMLTAIDASHLALALGIFVLLYALVSLLPSLDAHGSRAWALPIGYSGGLVGALFGSGGFVYVVYLNLRQLDKARFRASVAMTLFFDGTFRITGYSAASLYDSQTLTLVAMFVPVMLIAMYSGHRLQIRIAQKRFQQIVSMLLIACSVLLIAKALQ